MNTIKIINKFFSKTEAAKQAAFQLKMAKSSNRSISKIEILNAFELYKTNGWFKNNPLKKLGWPTEISYMVIIHYSISTEPTTVAKVQIQPTTSGQYKTSSSSSRNNRNTEPCIPLMPAIIKTNRTRIISIHKYHSNRYYTYRLAA